MLSVRRRQIIWQMTQIFNILDICYFADTGYATVSWRFVRKSITEGSYRYSLQAAVVT
jgi:hypothetical protein